MSIICIASIRPRRSRRRWAPWPGSSSRARCATSACVRWRRRRSSARTGRIPGFAADRVLAVVQGSRARHPSPVPRAGIAYVAYAPLGRGLLTGRIRSIDDLPPTDRRRMHPRFRPENLPHNLRLVAELEAMAQAKHASAAQIALAWLLAQGEDIVPIPGTSTRATWSRMRGGGHCSDARGTSALERSLCSWRRGGHRYHDVVLQGWRSELMRNDE